MWMSRRCWCNHSQCRIDIIARAMWIEQRQSGILLVETIVLLMAMPALSQKLAVKIINRQDKEMEYTYVVPERSTSTSNASVNCSESGDYLNCNARTRTNGSRTPPRRCHITFVERRSPFNCRTAESLLSTATANSRSTSRVQRAIIEVAEFLW
jgi:hypothetical protein